MELSDVGLAKVCDKHNIPRPPRGYWSKVKSGYKPPKPPLPKGADMVIDFDLEEGKHRRKRHRAATEKRQAAKAAFKEVETERTHPISERVLQFFNTGKEDEFGRVLIERATAPRILATRKASKRIAQFLSGLALALEEKGIRLANGTTENGVHFDNGQDFLLLDIEENTGTYYAEPEINQWGQRWTRSSKKERASGKLRLLIKAFDQTKGRCKWTESRGQSLQDHLLEIAARMVELFEIFEARREEDQKRKEENEESNREYERKRLQGQHYSYIESELIKRQFNLMRAAEQFRHAQEIKAFAEACVENWGGAHKLSSEQTKWVDYAERVAEKLNPLSDGYPDPVNDRAFDPELIPMNGPYPESETVPLPYPLLEIEHMLEKRRY